MLKFLITLAVFVFFMAISYWKRRSFIDKIKGEPLLTEEALVHAKSDHVTRFDQYYIIHFYVAERDTVVNCDVPKKIWKSLEKGTRGILCHQGGEFHTFETEDRLYRNKHKTGF